MSLRSFYMYLERKWNNFVIFYDNAEYQEMKESACLVLIFFPYLATVHPFRVF